MGYLEVMPVAAVVLVIDRKAVTLTLTLMLSSGPLST